jgi:transposase
MGNEGTPGKPTTRRHSPEEKARAVRRVADQIGCGVESLRTWVKQSDIDDGVEPGLTSVEAKRIREPEQENRELRRANDLLKRASAFFASTELDRPSR